MIVNMFVGFVVTALGAALALLPSGSGWSFDLTGAFSAMMLLDTWLPIHEAIAAAGVLCFVIASLFAFGLLRQVWRFVPFIGGG